MSQSEQQESLIVALSKCAIKIGIEKYLKTLITLSWNLCCANKVGFLGSGHIITCM